MIRAIRLWLAEAEYRDRQRKWERYREQTDLEALERASELIMRLLPTIQLHVAPSAPPEESP